MAIVAQNRALVPVNDWNKEDIPDANAVFINRVVHPRNIAIEDRRERARILKGSQLKNALRALKDLETKLSATNYDELQAAYNLTGRKMLTYIDEFEQLSPESTQDERDEVENRIEAMRVRQMRLSDELKAFAPMVEKHKMVKAVIHDHYLAIAREKQRSETKKQCIKEAYAFGEVIVETFTRLGYCYEIWKDKKKYVHKVGIERIEFLPDQICFKIAVSRKSMFGFRSLLPRGVHALDLIREETLGELAIACQRQVTTPPPETRPNGAWIFVNRNNATDGLMNYVTLDQVLTRYPEQEKGYYPIVIGVEQGRETSVIHLVNHPHFLIGGSTGGGKSNAINMIVCTLIQKHSPADIQFCLIDLKEGLEFQHFERIPHLLGPVVTEIDAAAQTLAKLERLRQERAKEMARIYAKSIDEYNVRRPNKKMPRIVVIFDEYAAIQVQKDMEKAIQTSVMQLLNKGRAVGIHLILCTQNPSVDIIPGPSKSNMAFRLAGAMPTKSASMTILGIGDAAELPDIRGRMLAMVGAKVWPIQTPHVRPEDLVNALNKAMEWPVTEAVKLPDTPALPGFTEDDILEIALNEGGSLGVRRIFPFVQDRGITYKQLSSMVNKIIEKKEIVYKNSVYKPSKRGNTWYLNKIEDLENTA